MKKQLLLFGFLLLGAALYAQTPASPVQGKPVSASKDISTVSPPVDAPADASATPVSAEKSDGGAATGASAAPVSTEGQPAEEKKKPK